MTVYREIPVITAPSQTFAMTLAGSRIDMALHYTEVANRWSFDLDIEGARVLTGRRIVTGVDLLAPFDLGIGRLIAAPVGGRSEEPGRTELPSGKVRLFHVDPNEIEAA